MNNVDVEIKKIFLQVFPDLEESEFNWKKKQNDYENWDSFSHLNVITLIEEKFNNELLKKELEILKLQKKLT